MATTISIGSGKGGTGKTMIAANLALLLAKSGKKVCLIDLDLGGADAHVIFGHLRPKRNLTDFLTRQTTAIDEIVHTFYSFNGLQLIPGTGDTLQTANMTYQEKQRLLRALGELDADIIVVDIGAGTSFHALDFFMHTDIQICTTLPDLTSIMDMYTFLKLATIRKVLSTFLAGSEVSGALKSKNFQSLSEVFDLAEETREGSRQKAQEALRYFHPLLIVNRGNANSQINKKKLGQMMRSYLSIEIPELGEIPEDSRVGESLKACMPVCELFPDTDASLALQAIAHKLSKIVELFAQQKTKKGEKVAQAA